MVHPDLMRLMAWFSLEQQLNSLAACGAAMDAKVALLTKAQSTGQIGATFPPLPLDCRHGPRHVLVGGEPL